MRVSLLGDSEAFAVVVADELAMMVRDYEWFFHGLCLIRILTSLL